MERILVHFSANEQKLICSDPFRVSSYKVQYIEAHFDLGQNWTGYDSVRAVWWNDFAAIGTVLDSLGVCRVPAEVLRRKGPVMVNLVGSISDGEVLTDRLTTYPVESGVVDANSRVDGADPHPATPSQVEQFAAAVREDADRAEAGAAAAEESAQSASDSATSARNSAESAHDDKVAIEEAIAEVIQQIEDFEQVQVVVNTLPPSSQATSDFTDGVLTLGIPQGVKGDTGNGIQSITKVSTSGLVDTYRITYTNGQTTTFTVTNGAKGDTGNGISSIAKTSTVGLVDTYTITYTDGTTSTFTVTNGEKGDKGDTGEVSLSELEDATIVQTLSDNEPYHFRRTNGGNGSGHREYDEIVGASVGWNQLIGSSGESFVSTTADTNGTSMTLRFRMKNSPYTAIGAWDNVQIGEINSILVPSISFVGVSLVHVGVTRNIAIYNDADAVITGGHIYLFKIKVTGNTVNEVGGVSTEDFQLIDLTLLNSSIADYVRSLNQQTIGSGVAWLKTHFPKLFDNGYQPYDSGSIKSVSGLTAHKMVGKNLLNPNDPNYENCTITSTGGKTTGNRRIATGFINCEPNKTYILSGAVATGGGGGLNFAGIAGYDGNLNFISRSYVNNQRSVSYTAPSNCRYIRAFEEITNEPAGGGNINPSVFAKYIQQLELGSTATDYEEYESHTYPLDSSVVLRGQYKLDTNNNLYADGDVWKSVGQSDRNYNEIDLGDLVWSYNGTRFQAFPSHCSKGNYRDKGIQPKYAQSYTSVADAPDKSFIFGTTDGAVYVKDSTYNDAESFKTAMSGIMLVYERDTAFTETATPYDNPQWCDSHGTEEYVGSELPVGHNTEYPMTLVDTMPSANGNYTMKLTVSGGKKTVTWESV